jgi:hypothetical protein
MKPFDFGIKTRYNYVDHHIRKKTGLINWWEEMAFFKTKKAKRQKDKMKLKNEINELTI